MPQEAAPILTTVLSKLDAKDAVLAIVLFAMLYILHHGLNRIAETMAAMRVEVTDHITTNRDVFRDIRDELREQNRRAMTRDAHQT